MLSMAFGLYLKLKKKVRFPLVKNTGPELDFQKALKTNLTEIVEMNTDKTRIITIDKLARLHNATCKKMLLGSKLV